MSLYDVAPLVQTPCTLESSYTLHMCFVLLENYVGQILPLTHSPTPHSPQHLSPPRSPSSQAGKKHMVWPALNQNLEQHAAKL